MVELGSKDGNGPRRRRWTFADCLFDETDWMLIVGGQRVPMEIKPLEVLRELLRQNGRLVTKDDLINVVWPDVIVVKASLTTAIRKLRRAMKDDGRGAPIIETVSRIGYRLAVPIALEEEGPNAAADTRLVAAVAAGGGAPAGTADAPTQTSSRRLKRLAIAGIAVIAIGVTAMTLLPSREVSATKAARGVSQQEARDAIRSLDVGAVQQMLAAGWNPNAEIDTVGSAALHYLAEICEWNPSADRNRMVLLARAIYEGGGRLDQRNAYGDTPYSIAKAQRYCGPNHPLTVMMRATCNDHGDVMEGCEASYELARRNRR